MTDDGASETSAPGRLARPPTRSREEAGGDANAVRIALGTRPQRRRYLALGWVLGVGALGLGLALAEPFAAVDGLWAVVGAACLVALAAVAAYDGAGAPVVVAFVSLVAAGLVPFLVTAGIARTVTLSGALAIQTAFVAAVALVAGVALGLVGFLVGAGGRWLVESRG